MTMTENAGRLPESMRPICKCGNLCKPNGVSRKTGKRVFNSYCRQCAKVKHGRKERKNRALKSAICNSCGFAGHPCQMDLDHMDGNRKNYASDNLQTLCANCHRLKTFKNKDWFLNP